MLLHLWKWFLRHNKVYNYTIVVVVHWSLYRKSSLSHSSHLFLFLFLNVNIKKFDFDLKLYFDSNKNKCL